MDVAIIGSGIIGLMSALTLTDAGFNVIIIARDVPGDDNKNWASPWAGAAIFPHPDASGQDLQVETFKYFWALAHKDPESGVQIVKATEFYDDRVDESSIWYKHIVQGYRRIPYKDLPEKAKIGIQYETMTVNPEKFLPLLKNELQSRGVCFIQQGVSQIEAVKDATGCKAVVNASGLGASNLASDNSVLPVRGQTMLVKTDFNELMMWQGSHYTYVIPRMYTGGVIVGGVSQEGSFDQEVDKDLRVDILKRVKMLAGGLLDAVDLTRDVQMDIVAFRPARRDGYRLEVERDVVHAYGFGGLGYTYCYGAALEVRDLVQLLRGGEVSPKSRL